MQEPDSVNRMLTRMLTTVTNDDKLLTTDATSKHKPIIQVKRGQIVLKNLTIMIHYKVEPETENIYSSYLAIE